jgi:hypothetical protein
MIESICRVAEEIIQKEHNWRSAALRNTSKDIHAGVCGHHASSRAIAAKAFRAGFYWLTAIEDAKDIV